MGESVGEFDQGAAEASAEQLDSAERETYINDAAQEIAERRIQEHHEKEVADNEYDPTETAEILINHYGDQWFKYGTYEGTIADILEQCSAIQFLLMMGPEKVMQTFDKYKAERPKAIEDDNKNDIEHSEEPDELDDQEHAQKNVDVAEVKKPETTKLDASVKQEEKIEVAPAAKTVVKNVPVQKVVVVPESDVQSEPIKEELSEQKQETPKKHQVKALVVETTVEASEPQEPEAHELSDFVIKNEMDVAEESALVEGEVLETIDEVVEQEAVTSIPENFEAWQEIAEQAVVLEEFLTKVIDDMDAPEYVEGTEQRDVSEELNTEELEQFEEAAPELYAMYIEVAAIKESIKKLQTARTKEECETGVEEIIARVTELLRMLGYDNPEKVIRDFVYAHPLSSLNDLIEELEKTMRRRARFEILSAAQKKHPYARHLSFAKFVLYVLGAFVPKTNPEASM